MWHHLHILFRHNWQYLWFWKNFFLLHLFTRPPIFQPVHNGFYPSKWWVDGSLLRAMHLCNLYCRNSIIFRSWSPIKSQDIFVLFLTWSIQPHCNFGIKTMGLHLSTTPHNKGNVSQNALTLEPRHFQFSHICMTVCTGIVPNISTKCANSHFNFNFKFLSFFLRYI